MHVTGVEHVERTRGDGEAMHAYGRRECMERLQTKGSVLSRGRGMGRAHHDSADGSSTSQGNHHEPQMEMEVEREVEGDADAQEVGDDEQQQQHVQESEPDELDDYPGDPHDLTMLTKYHVHVAKMTADGMTRHYTYYCDTLMIIKCC